MNKNNCLQEIRSRKLLSVLKTTDNHEITLVIKLGGKVMKQNQFEILLAKIDEVKTEFATRIDEVNTKIDGVKIEFNTKIDEIKTEFATRTDEVKTELKAEIKKVQTDVKEIKVILKKHDDLFVEHKWLNKSSFEQER